jgi:hypothetical protein
MGAGKENCEGTEGVAAKGELGLLPIFGRPGKEDKMNCQENGLRITAQGITPDWLPQAKTQLSARREAKRREAQQSADQHDLITPEEVMEHLNAAERNGIWSR